MLQKSSVTLPGQAINLTLSTPIPSGLYFSLLLADTVDRLLHHQSSNSYDRVHFSRHHTLLVSCH